MNGCVNVHTFAFEGGGEGGGNWRLFKKPQLDQNGWTALYSIMP